MKKWICVYVIVAFSVLGIGIYVRSNDEQIPANEVMIPGTVVGYESHRKEGDTTYSEVISFNLNGTEHHFTRNLSVNWKPKIGRVRQIMVNPARPSAARVRMWPWLEKIVPRTIKQYPHIFLLWFMGCSFFGVGFLGFMYHYEFFRRAIVIPGYVTSYITRSGIKGGGTVYVEVISYNFDGQMRTVEGNVGMPFKPKMGTQREIGVDPQNPQRARVQSSTWYWMIFAAVGLLLWAGIFV